MLHHSLLRHNIQDLVDIVQFWNLPRLGEREKYCIRVIVFDVSV